MSKKQWMVLLMLFLTYLLLGAAMFHHIESNLEMEKLQKSQQERIVINALLHEHYMPNNEEDQNIILEKLTQYCGKSVYNVSDAEPETLKWDFYNSFYFAYTVVSTIGYGNLAPTNMLSRILMMFYGVVGIPVNGILLAQLGEFFSIVFIRAHRKYKSYKKNREDECMKKLTPLETRKAGLAAQILMYLVPGFAMFIFIPAFLFSYFEGWTYEEAVYYAFVTLTTIGFGDYVAGQDNTKGSGILFTLYKTFLIAWISFGLGYVVMIMTFITRGMRSKKIIRLEHKLAVNLKQTQSKIWSEFNKEVNYLRRVFNELQLSKVKRVYMDEYDYEIPPTKFLRSNSFPDLRELVYGGLAPITPPRPRRRANSEVVPMETHVARVVSETDLQRIDKTATFATHAMVQPAELLARLVNILGYIPPPSDDDEQTPEIESRGVQGFSDREILSTEKHFPEPNWNIGGNKIPLGKPRSRAVSEVRLDTSFDSNLRNQEWTWSGPAASLKIQQLIKARRKNAAACKDSNNKETKSKFSALNLPKSTLLPRWIKQLSNKKDGQRTRNSVSVGDLEAGSDDDYMSHITELTDRSTYFTHTGAANLSSSLEGSNLLEETSLADFLRALTAVQARVGAVPEEYIKKPQRKMGTACLTPPKLPSLLALFSPLPGTSSVPQSNQNTITSEQSNPSRRFSVRTTDNFYNSTPMYSRRSSFAPTGVRRFSLRKVPTPLATPSQASPYLSGSRQDRSSPPPAYSAESYVCGNPKEPLVSMEGAPGVSSPISGPSSRRSSLKTTQIDLPPGPSKTVGKWRAGMLQRQINQMRAQKRVRALSLSDMSTEKTRSPERSNPVSPLALDPTVKIESKDFGGKNLTQRTVTIVSPSLDDRGKENDKKQRRPFKRAISVSNNPFSSIDYHSEQIDPCVIDLGSQGGDLEREKTVFQVLNEVKRIETAPMMNKELIHQVDSSDPSIITPINRDSKSGDLDEKPIKISELGGKELLDRQSVSGISGEKEMTDSCRKISTVSEHNSSDNSLTSISRRNSMIKSSIDKPRVSVESYKTLMEQKIDKPSENPFERYRKASAQGSSSNREDNKVFNLMPSEKKIATGLEEGPRESTS